MFVLSLHLYQHSAGVETEQEVTSMPEMWCGGSNSDRSAANPHTNYFNIGQSDDRY